MAEFCVVSLAEFHTKLMITTLHTRILMTSCSCAYNASWEVSSAKFKVLSNYCINLLKYSNLYR